MVPNVATFQLQLAPSVALRELFTHRSNQPDWRHPPVVVRPMWSVVTHGHRLFFRTEVATVPTMSMFFFSTTMHDTQHPSVTKTERDNTQQHYRGSWPNKSAKDGRTPLRQSNTMCHKRSEGSTNEAANDKAQTVDNILVQRRSQASVAGNTM